MSQQPISAVDPYERKRVAVLDSEMAYIDIGQGDPIVFLHGNPTSSYLWRNIMPHLEGFGSCLAPDLIGMGQSGKNPSGSYRFVDHYRYLDAWFEAVGVSQNIVLVVHDWGSGLGFHWAYQHRNESRVQAIAYMEALVQPVTWEAWPESARGIFQAMRSPKGENLVLERNFFVERILPVSIMRKLSAEEMAVYRQPYLEAGEVRRPTLTWPREINISVQPEALVYAKYSTYLKRSKPTLALYREDAHGIMLFIEVSGLTRATQSDLHLGNLHRAAKKTCPEPVEGL